MLAILTTHPIQYQVPLWQALAQDGRVPFEVWYLTDHGVRASHDREFDKTFAWDLNTLSGYPYRFLDVAAGASPGSFLGCRLREPLRQRLRSMGARAVWVQGWQVAAYWQAVWEAGAAGVEVWLRGESNDLAPRPPLKRVAKRVALAQFFRRVDQFLYIGSANRRLYQAYGVPDDRLHPAPYAVDIERFAKQAAALRGARSAIRQRWHIADDAFGVLFCGKFIPKKRPLDLVAAARLLVSSGRLPNAQLLFVGSGEMGQQLRSSCDVVFDADPSHAGHSASGRQDAPKASFTGFLNQTDISMAYVAADCLVLPSDHAETWGLVVNEAMASGLPCVVSDACGCAEELYATDGRSCVYTLGSSEELADALQALDAARPSRERSQMFCSRHTIAATVEAAHSCYVSGRGRHAIK